MNAFFLIDKPIGITSFDIIRHLKKVFQIKRIGHTGTLDPLATGLVLVAVGNYTKLIPYFEKDSKTYEFKVNLDGVTASYDLEQPREYISSEQKKYFSEHITQDMIEKILRDDFLGEISQVPPKYSAIKINGQKALDKVRKGQDFEMKSRLSTVFSLEVISYAYPEVFLCARVSAGTYVRSIAHDLGQKLGSGGYVTFLRRTHIDALDLSLACQLEEVSSEHALDMKYLFSEEKYITLPENICKRMDVGLPTIIHLNLPNGEYFVKNFSEITHIVKYNDGNLACVRKI